MKNGIKIAVLGVLIIGIMGIPALSVTADNRVFYSDKNTRFSELEELESTYLPHHTITFALKGDQEDSLQNTFAAAYQLEEKLWSLPSTLQTHSILSFPRPNNSTESSFSITTLEDTKCFLGSIECDIEWVSAFPEVVGRLISADRKTLAVSSVHQLNRTDVGNVRQIASLANEIAIEIERDFPAISVFQTGGIPMMNAFSEAAEKDSKGPIPLALLILGIVMLLITRSPWATTVLLVSGLSSAAFALGFAGHLGFVLNTATSITGLIVLCTTLATGDTYMGFI